MPGFLDTGFTDDFVPRVGVGRRLPGVAPETVDPVAVGAMRVVQLLEVAVVVVVVVTVVVVVGDGLGVFAVAVVIAETTNGTER